MWKVSFYDFQRLTQKLSQEMAGEEGEWEIKKGV